MSEYIEEFESVSPFHILTRLTWKWGYLTIPMFVQTACYKFLGGQSGRIFRPANTDKLKLVETEVLAETGTDTMRTVERGSFFTLYCRTGWLFLIYRYLSTKWRERVLRYLIFCQESLGAVVSCCARCKKAVR